MQFQWNSLGLGWGEDKWGAGEVLEGFAVDAGQQPRNTHERETLEQKQ